MILNQIMTLKILASARNEKFEGRDHLVVPVVLLVEGVHAGSNGETYYSPDVLASEPGSWNGIPLPVMHPKDGDNYVSANSPQIIDEQSVGRLFNVKYEADKVRLVGELWIDVLKAQKISPAVLDAAQQGNKLEVSTSMYSAGDGTAGEWHGEAYLESLVEFRPDHLALLPGAVGACSVDDGCGMNNNSGESKMLAYFTRILDAVKNIRNEEVSHDDIWRKLQAALDEINGEMWSSNIREVFDKYLIYSTSANVEVSDVTGERKLYKQSYVINTEGKAVLMDDKVEVIEKTEYIIVTVDGGTTVNKELIMKKDELITSLIACCHNKLTDGDKEWLNKLPEKQIETMAALSKEKPVDFGKPVEGVIQAVVGNDVTPAPEPNKEPDKTVVANKEPDKSQTPEEFIANAPPEMQETFNRALKRDRMIKDALVKALVSNDRCDFTEDQLKTKDIGELETLAKLARIENDHSLNPGAVTSNEEDKDAIEDMPPTFDPEEKKGE